MNNCIPFDLQTALAHPERVTNGNGLQAVDVRVLPKAAAHSAVAVTWESGGLVGLHSKNGVSFGGSRPALFLAAPEPAYVPWDSPDEAPDGVWFRRKDAHSLVSMVVGFNERYVLVGTAWLGVHALFQNYEWHPDRRHTGQWNVCGKPTK